MKASDGNNNTEEVIFPPAAPSERLIHEIISGFCKDIHPDSFVESGCCVCGALAKVSTLKEIKETELDLEEVADLLTAKGVTRLERKKESDPIQEVSGPIFDLQLVVIPVSGSSRIRRLPNDQGRLHHPMVINLPCSIYTV